MYQHDVKVRVRYADTDQMGYVYYGNYATYYEIARVESFRAMGFSYRDLEESGVMMPLIELKSRFIKPALYDDLLTIRVLIKELPGTRITYHYEVFNEKEVLLNTGETTLVFVNRSNNRPARAPEELVEAFKPHFGK